MAKGTSMLGKRKAQDPPSSPIKTRLRSTAAHDDLPLPKRSRRGQAVIQVHEDEDPFVSSPKASPNTASPARRVALSPIKGNEANGISTPLQKTHLATPQSKRHYDAIEVTTPRHRVHVAAKLPSSPRTPQTPRSTSAPYNAARQLFARSAAPGQIVGRDAERAELKAFLDEGVRTKTGRSLYISGAPGTGKTAVLHEICAELQEQPGVRTAFVNCMSIRTAGDLYANLIAELDPSATAPSRKSDPAALKALFFPRSRDAGPVYVVTLDEIDHLLTLDLGLLYALFEWSLDPQSRLILIGIANALDLTDRFLPKLRERGLRPQLLPFRPYTAPQIASVITQRLTSLLPADAPDRAFVPFVHPAAVQFAARKVAAQTGDLRKAFDMVRRALDVVEAEAKAAVAAPPPSQAPLTPTKTPSPLADRPNPASSSPLSASSLDMDAATGRKVRRATAAADPLAHLTPATAPRATLAHLARLAAATFGHGTAARLRALTLPQKAALCALVSREKRAANRLRRQQQTLARATPSKSAGRGKGALLGAAVREAWDAYRGLCAREAAGRVPALSRVEFGEVVEGLEGLGLVGSVGAAVGGRGAAWRAEEKRVETRVAEAEVRAALEGVEGEVLRALLVNDDDDRED